MAAGIGQRAFAAIMDWSAREAWRDSFEAHLEEHFGDALEEFDLDLEQAEETLGEAFASLFGLVVEHFASRDWPTVGDDPLEFRNLVDDYLKRRGWKEGQAVRAYLRALRESNLDLFEVVDVSPGSHIVIRSLVLAPGSEPIRVAERSGSRHMRRWDRLAARILTIRGERAMAGGCLRFSVADGRDILNRFEEALREFDQRAAEAVEDEELRKIAAAMRDHAREIVCETVLPTMVTGLWLDRALGASLGRDRPELANAEGHPIVFCVSRYPVASGIDVGQVADRLDRVPAFVRDDDAVMRWSIRVPPPTPGIPAAQGAATLASWGDQGPMGGSVHLVDHALVLKTNSRERQARSHETIAAALGPLVGSPTHEETDVETAMAAARNTAVVDGPEIPVAQRAAILQEFADRHYRATLDQPVPALGGMSPRDAARDPARRELVVDWIKGIENGHAGDEASFAYDASWIWRELGLDHLRK